MLHLSSDNTSHLIHEIKRLHPKSNAGQSNGQWGLGNWSSSYHQICASNSSCQNIKHDITDFSEFIEVSVSHFKGSEDSSEMHGEIGDFSKEKTHQSSSGIIHHFTADNTDQGKHMMDNEAGIGESVVDASKEIIEEIGT